MAVHGGERLGFVEGLRGVAIGLVLVFHATVWAGLHGSLTHFVLYGHAGVDLFFVISGFCMLWPVLRDGRVGDLAPARFYVRRFLRIAPPFYVAVAAALAMSALTWQLGGRSWWPSPMQSVFPTSAGNLAGNLATHATFTHGFVDRYSGSIDGAFWSLSTEWQFYALLPALIFLLRWLGPVRGIAVTLAIPVVYVLALHELDPSWLRTTVGQANVLDRLAEFGAGMLAAWLVSSRRRFRLVVIWTVGWAAVALYVDRYGPATAIPFAYAAAFGGLTLCGWQMPAVRGALEWGPLRWLGRISYSAYLIHGTVFMALAIPVSRADLGYGTRLAVMMVVGVPAALAVATVMHRLIERPAVRWSHAIRGARRVPTARSAPT